MIMPQGLLVRVHGPLEIPHQLRQTAFKKKKKIESIHVFSLDV